MNRLQSALVAAILLVGALVVVLALRNRQPPVLPADEEHASFPGAEPCLACHGPDGGLPRSQNHPLGDDCLRCHGRN
jgi:hypothetical protein